MGVNYMQSKVTNNYQILEEKIIKEMDEEQVMNCTTTISQRIKLL